MLKNLSNDPLVALADRFVAEAIIPKRKRDDAVHLAYAYFHEMDVLLSWNQRHIVKLNTKIKANAIARLEGYKLLEICTPEEVIDEGT